MDSLTFYAALVEIEKPGKKLFRKDGVPSGEFTQARDQLAEWRAWFDVDVNQLKFRSDFGIPDEVMRGRAFELHLILVYGRRNETKGNASRAQKRRYLLNGQNESLVSYDRLTPDRCLKDSLTVSLNDSGSYRVKYVPPTFCMSPQEADDYPKFVDLDKAIKAQPDWKADRKKFLERRLQYWMKWAITPQPGLRGFQPGYRE
jgi:hypothetical protein